MARSCHLTFHWRTLLLVSRSPGSVDTLASGHVRAQQPVYVGNLPHAARGAGLPSVTASIASVGPALLLPLPVSGCLRFCWRAVLRPPAATSAPPHRKAAGVTALMTCSFAGGDFPSACSSPSEKPLWWYPSREPSWPRQRPPAAPPRPHRLALAARPAPPRRTASPARPRRQAPACPLLRRELPAKQRHMARLRLSSSSSKPRHQPPRQAPRRSFFLLQSGARPFLQCSLLPVLLSSGTAVCESALPS